MSKSKFLVYLSGPINQCTNLEAGEWRDDAKQLFSTYFSSYLIDVLDPFKMRDARQDPKAMCKEIVFLDKRDILRSDCLLVNWNSEKPSVGTIMEILFAWEHNKPVVLIMDSKYKTPIDISPWLEYHITKYFYSLQEAVEYIGEELT